MRVLWAALIAAALLVGCSERELSGFVREPTPVVGESELPDVSRDGEAFRFRAGDGGLLLVYFGYTACPDVCPTTLADTRTALSRIGDDADRVEVAMATVDPSRDTEDILTRYVQSFIPGAHALRTTEDARLREAAGLFGVTYDVWIADDGDVEVTHTGSLYAVDDEGKLLVTWPFGTSIDDLAADLELLLRSA